MPQKPIFRKAPVLYVPNCFPSCGTIRSADGRISDLYEKASAWSGRPCLWEGLFRVACLVKNKPAEEPVASLIREALRETESGAFPGTAAEQICIARAAFALFEYNTDRTILKRIAEWLRYLEIEFESLSLQDRLLYQPADLMELMIRYYQATGLKSVLRLCIKLRASAFDWTTALHTFQQSIPIRVKDGGPADLVFSVKPDEMEYDEKQKLINHAELVADGVRFTLYAGLFSGHGHDLASGKAVWGYLKKHHRALCGGTTADPYLCGTGADQAVNNSALAAWTEAFAAQMAVAGSEWAADELVRIVFNGLDDCLNHKELPEFQKVNTLKCIKGQPDDPVPLYARLLRAVSAAYSHAVTLTEQGIRINYLLPARIMCMIRKTQVILQSEEDSLTFRCKNPVSAPVDIFFPRTGTATVLLKHGTEENVRKRTETGPEEGIFIHTEEEWKDGDGFLFVKDGDVLHEETHHQGVCFIERNRLLSVKASCNRYAFTVAEAPVQEKGGISICLRMTGGWKTMNSEPADIPVLPAAAEETVKSRMTPYAETPARITMFPRTKDACLK